MLVFLSGANKLATGLWLEESVAIPGNKGGVNWGGWGEDGSLTWGMGGFCGAHMKETEAKESQGGGQMAGLRNGTHRNPVKILSAKDMRLPSPPGAPFGVYDSTSSSPVVGTDD